MIANEINSIPIEMTILITNCPNLEEGVKTSVITAACWFTTDVRISKSEHRTVEGEGFTIELKRCYTVNTKTMKQIQSIHNKGLLTSIEVIKYESNTYIDYSSMFDDDTRKALNMAIKGFTNELKLEDEK